MAICVFACVNVAWSLDATVLGVGVGVRQNARLVEKNAICAYPSIIDVYVYNDVRRSRSIRWPRIAIRIFSKLSTIVIVQGLDGGVQE